MENKNQNFIKSFRDLQVYQNSYQLIDTYDKTSRQLYKLAEAWNKFKNRSRETPHDTVIEN